MTKDEVAISLGMLREVYGKQSDTPNPDVTIEIWYRYLSDEPSDLVQQAFDKYIAENVFAPKPADILNLVEKTKWQLWEQKIIADNMGEPFEVPDEYRPRCITRRPKQYEINNEKKVMRQLADFNRIGLIEKKET